MTVLCEEHVVCSECGAERVKTPTGRVCPNGHGRIWPQVSQAAVRKCMRDRDARIRLAAMPAATRRRGVWSITGMPGDYRWVSACKITAVVGGSHVIARAGSCKMGKPRIAIFAPTTTAALGRKE